MGEDCELEGGLDFIGSLFENRTCRDVVEMEGVNKLLNKDGGEDCRFEVLINAFTSGILRIQIQTLKGM